MNSLTFQEWITKIGLDFYRNLRRVGQYDNELLSPANLSAGVGLLLMASESDATSPTEIQRPSNVPLLIESWDESKAPGQRRYLLSLRSHDDSGDKLRTDVFHHTSSTEALFSEDAKHRLGPEAVPDEGPTASEPACTDHEAPDYKCDKPEGMNTRFQKILTALNRCSIDPDYQLDFANRLYADSDIDFTQKFLYCALKCYLTEVDEVDLKKNEEEVLKQINLWVEVQTHGKIKDILPKKKFDSKACLVQTNALSFKGQWDRQFNKEFTQEGVFHLNESNSTTVQYMYQKGQYNIGTMNKCGAQVIEIPYRNNVMSLFILLPREASVHALQQLEDELTAEKLLDWGSVLQPQDTEVVIPKFSVGKMIDITTSLDLSSAIDAKKANPSPTTTTTKDLVLIQFPHGTFFEVDEEGGEKATGCHLIKKKNHWESFVADHPFVYYVLEKHTKNIIVMGRFNKPESREVDSVSNQ